MGVWTQQKSGECQADEAKEIVWQAEEKWRRGRENWGKKGKDYRAGAVQAPSGLGVRVRVRV